MAKLSPAARWCGLALLALPAVAPATELTVTRDAPPPSGGMSLDGATLAVDPGADTVVHQAAGLLAADLSRVSGQPSTTKPAAEGKPAILVGTVGDGGPVDQLVTAGKVDAAGVKGQWETFAWQVVDDGGRPALVIVGSDRRGTAYGCTELSKAIGVSPWTWWADVPVQHHAQLAVSPGRHVDGPPGVKYRGIFLNDEDWGLRPWASQTFDPESKRTEVGPKTYDRLFQLMLRLRLNLLWPAMHPGSGEFGSIPGNAADADRWAIVMGASHCEPMLRNNVYWNKADGPWRYDTNKARILPYWADSADQRGQYEAVWTLGIRGIHDSPMDGPRGTPARVDMVEGIFADQRKLIADKVTKKFGPPAELFCPYKEVLPLYDAGMKVPDEVTLVWPDDNYGYIRHLPDPAERARAGGNGVYYHVSYWGHPQSYLWVESTSPGLIWEELHKAWANDAGRLWVVNVGDLKPAEVATTFYADLAWSPDRWGPDAQDVFFHDFFSRTFGPELAGPLGELETAYYKLAAERRPDQFQYQWINSLSPTEQAALMKRYAALERQEAAVAKSVPAAESDAYFEMVGYAARMLADAGQLYLHDAAAQYPDHGDDLAAAKHFYADIVGQTRRYNDGVQNGKWRHMMSITPKDVEWPSDVGGTHRPRKVPARPAVDAGRVTVDAAAFTASTADHDSAWHAVAGLGYSGRAITVLPATAAAGHPTVAYAFDVPAAADAADVRFDLLPTMRVSPTGQLRFAVSVDGGEAVTLDVPGGTAGDEHSGPRQEAVMTNRVTVPLPAGPLAAGHHTLTVSAVDPGVVLDQVELPPGTTPMAGGR